MDNLDIDLLRTFVGIAEEGGFKAAGDAIGATQSAISVRLKKLEDRLGRRLMERTPRAIALTPFGSAFLADARRLLLLHDDVFDRAQARAPARRLTIGFSEHTVGRRFTSVLAGLRSSLPQFQLSVTLALSEQLIEDFDAGRYDAVFVLRIPGWGSRIPESAELVIPDPIGWVAAPNFHWDRTQPLPLVSIAPPCGLRALSTQHLDAAGIVWTESFSSRGMAAVQAAIAAGLGIGCLSRSCHPLDGLDCGDDLGLPTLPASAHYVLSRRGDAGIARFVARIADGLRGA